MDSRLVVLFTGAKWTALYICQQRRLENFVVFSAQALLIPSL
jgi:hypothetical protein